MTWLRRSNRTRVFNASLIATIAVGVVTCVQLAFAYDNPPTPEEYRDKVGGDAEVVPAKEYEIDGKRVYCGHRPTVTDNSLDDYGAAYPGFLIMNPRLLERVTTPVKMWIYAHECGHQFRGAEEAAADCFAVQRGRAMGWLTAEGLEEVCQFISPARADSAHFSGEKRCEHMRKCYADPRRR